MNGTDVLRRAYGGLIDAIAGPDDEAGWRPSRCAGWTVRDVVFHLLNDAQRGLVALHTLAADPPDSSASGRRDVDAVTYWRAWQPNTDRAAKSLRWTRVAASTWSSFAHLSDLFVETAHAVLVAADERSPDDLVATQGHTLTVDALCSTLAVEAAVHHLDLRLGRPTAEALGEVRRVLDGLLGAPAPIADDERYALVGTGREPLTSAERDAFGNAAARLPLFG